MMMMIKHNYDDGQQQMVVQLWPHMDLWTR
jgi:hypothetical protein